MIDLKNTKMELKDKEAVKVYCELAKEQGLSLMGGKSVEEALTVVEMDSTLYWVMCDERGLFVREEHEFDSFCTTGDVKIEGYKVLSPEDLVIETPAVTKTKTSYEKVEGIPKLSELFTLYEEDELFTLSMNNYLPVLSIEAVIKLGIDRGAYRKV